MARVRVGQGTIFAVGQEGQQEAVALSKGGGRAAPLLRRLIYVSNHS